MVGAKTREAEDLQDCDEIIILNTRGTKLTRKKMSISPWHDVFCALEEDCPKKLKEDVVGGDSSEQASQGHSDQPRRLLLGKEHRRGTQGPSHRGGGISLLSRRRRQKPFASLESGRLEVEQEGPLLRVRLLRECGQLGLLLVEQENLLRQLGKSTKWEDKKIVVYRLADGWYSFACDTRKKNQG